MDDNFYKELQQDFLRESLSLIERFEAIFLTENSSNSETVNEAFRIAHTIKGGSSAVGYTDISEYTHKVEDFLSKFRDDPLFMNEQSVSILLEFSDIIKNEFTARLSGGVSNWITGPSLEKIRTYIFTKNSTANISDLSHSEEFDRARLSNEESLHLVPTESTSTQKLIADSALAVPSPGPANSSTSASTVPKTMSQTPKNPPDSSSKPKAVPAQKKAVQNTVKVDVARLESIFDTIGEVVVFKNQMKEHLKKEMGEDHKIQSISENLDILVKDLYEKALGLRMTPLQPLFQRVQRTLRDLAIQLNKKVHIEIFGEETEIDRNLFETLTDPMIHLIRNAIDHGVENLEERQKSGKPEFATISIKAYHQAGQVMIEINDDGRGVDTSKVFNLALKKGLIPEGSQISTFTDEQIQNFLFMPGFSTADKISDLSGRGVGLDVVRTSIESFHGKIQIKSHFGKGTQFLLSLPLTTALIDGIVFKLAGQRFIIPTSSIDSIHRLDPKQITLAGDGQLYLNHFDHPIPVVKLSDHFKLKSSSEQLVAVLSQYQNRTIALLFCEVQNQVQAVVKPLPPHQKRNEYIGAAVLGDGLTTIILDIQSAVQGYQGRAKEAA